ncbi:MAG: polysaccharide deacetylase family protein [Candidatus Berkelbacteria bacterium]|nr:polysaccharide deacetylase family protein [Candidatus Berkelbacteria bacterium]
MSDELLTSKSTLENIVGKNIISFCYPSGKNNDVVDVATKNAGYLTATTTNPGISTTKSDKYKVPRIRINPGLTITEFEKKL